MEISVFSLIFAVYVAIFVIVSVAKAKKINSGNTSERSSDGHFVPPDESLTCETNAGHRHPKMSQEDINDFGKRYIVHNEPETGYVILNGVRRRLDECSKL